MLARGAGLGCLSFRFYCINYIIEVDIQSKDRLLSLFCVHEYMRDANRQRSDATRGSGQFQAAEDANSKAKRLCAPDKLTVTPLAGPNFRTSTRPDSFA